MSKYRVYELAKEFNTDSKVILDILKRNKFKAANNFSSVGEEERTAIKNSLSNKGAKPQAKAPAAPAAQKPAAKPVEKRAAKPQAGKQNHGNSGSNGNNGRTERNERNERRSDAGRNNGNGNHNGGNRAASGSNRPSHNSGGNSGNNGGNRNSNGGGNNNRGGNRNDRRNSSRNERGGRNDRNNRFGSKNDRNRRGRNNKRGGQQAPKVEIAHPKHIKLPETIAVKDLASKMSYTAAEVVKKLFMMGVMATINQEIDFDTAALVASEFGVTCEELPPEVDPTEIPEIEDDPKTLKLRPPVVTVMGHVDHGKTSLLDCIRNTHVQTHEAGGITQHIGAYQVNCKGKKIVFLDTPGHEAFTAMRARGAQITDIAILVVAADDGVMPQTIEAIHHAKSAGVPIIVAINKIDKPGANPDKVRGQLTEYGLVPEEYGGNTMFVDISAKQGTNVDKLLEAVLLTADAELDLRANPDMDARGATVEARLDKGRGAVATVLVQSGTLHIGDAIVAGTSYGRVRAMLDENGNHMQEAGPSTPVQVLGLTSVPTAGDLFLVASDDRTARQIAEKRQATERAAQLAKRRKVVSLESLKEQFAKSEVDMLNIVIKGDSSGSVEALEDSLMKIEVSDEVGIQVIHRGVGAITQNDVNLATVDKAVIIGFNVRPNRQVADLAEREGVEIKYYSIIYKAIEDIEASLKGMLKPEYEEVVTSHSEIREIFRSSKFGNIAGVMVQDGEVKRGTKCRILRNGIATVNDLEISSLRRFKDDVNSVKEGYEAGINLGTFNDIEIGDIIETFEMQEIERK